MDTNERLYPLDKPFPHRMPIQTRFGDYDIFGHVNNNNFLAYFDLGKIAYMDDIKRRRMTPREIGVVVVNINIDFLAPAEISEELEVLTTVLRIGNRSITLYQRVVCPQTGQVKAQATTVLAGFDPETRTSAPLDSDTVATIKTFENIKTA